MKREIKFRAWQSKEKKMYVQGDTVDENRKVFWDIWENNSHISDPMQFTGLIDKNGKEIYEDDWCTAKFRTKNGIQVVQGRIIMDEFMWCIDCTGCVGDDIFSINRLHDFEIIGNIYENPERLVLAKGKNSSTDVQHLHNAE